MTEYNLTSPRVIKQLMEKHGVRFHKGLGQNFLVDANIVRKIVDAGHITSQDTVIEVGPGAGVLTAELAARAGQVIAVEKDRHLIPLLAESIPAENVTVINSDILELDWDSFLSDYSIDKFKVVANLPYYITSPIIMDLLERRLPVENIVVMVQKEVAERLVASPGTKDYGALTVAVQYYSEPEIAFLVPKTVFIPQPKVGSAVVRLKVRSNISVRPWLSAVVKAAFGMRRKTLRNALNKSEHLPSSVDIDTLLSKSGIDGSRRAETLSVEEFCYLADSFDILLSESTSFKS